MTKLILVRHAETEGNLGGIWHGRLDAPLTERGRRQIEATGPRVAELAREHGIDAFYVSPLARARSTAASITTSTGVVPQIEEALTEFDLGDWEGRTFLELRQTEDLWNRWAQDPTFAPPNGESPASFGRRVVSAMQRLADAHPGQTVLIVTHGGFISNLLDRWLGGKAGEWRTWDPHNCAVSVLERLPGEEAWRPLLVNDISHLPEDAINRDAPAYQE